MSTQAGEKCITVEANADLSTKQYYIAKITTGGKAALCGDGELGVGIIQNKPAAGEAAVLAISGKVKAVAGGSVTVGGPVASDSNGKIVNAATGDYVLGTALQAASSGDIFEIIFNNSGKVA
jgi:hypothetical protein